MRRSFLRRIHHLRGVLISPPLVLCVFCFSYETELDELIWPLGTSIFLLGFAFRVWAQQHIQRHLKVSRHLVTTGPYSFVRNPLYVGNVLMCLAAVIISELLWLIPITILWCTLVYFIVVRCEESQLLRRYGQSYRRYMLEVPRWFPRVQGFRNMGLINGYLRTSIVAELHCLYILLPYILKEVISS